MFLEPPSDKSLGRDYFPSVIDAFACAVNFWPPRSLHIGNVEFLMRQVKRFRGSQTKVHWQNFYRNELLAEHRTDLSRLPDDIEVTPYANGLIVTLPGDPVNPSYDSAVHVRRALGLPVIEDSE